jgi:ABC-2 type transport system ATP-binding protein
LLKFNDISKSYQNKFVINKLTYHFDGERYCIVGSNGSGKTTLLMLAAGLENVSSGQVTLDGEPIISCDIKRVIGVSSDKIMLPDFLTPQQLLEFHCSQYSCLFPNTLINHLGFSVYLTTQICDLSLGNLKKISLLLALAHQPRCLLLDEPTTGLDDSSRVWLLDYLIKYQGQIIVTSHEKSFTENLHYQQVTMSELNQSNSAFS